LKDVKRGIDEGTASRSTPPRKSRRVTVRAVGPGPAKDMAIHRMDVEDGDEVILQYGGTEIRSASRF